MGPHNHSRSMVFWRLHGHASMGGAESMSERRMGVPRLRHGAGVGVGHVCAEGTVHGPISHSGPKIWKKRTQKLWYTAGWESRSVGWVTGVNARATGTRRPRGDDALASIPSHAHRGGDPVFLEQLSSTDDCSCPLATRPCWTCLSHTPVCIEQNVCSSSHWQRSSAVYNGCREAGDDHPFIVLTETKFSFRCIPVWIGTLL